MSYRDWTEKILKQWPQNRTSAAYRKRFNSLAPEAKRICHLGCGYDKNQIVAPFREQTEIIGVDLDERAGPKYHSPFWLANAEEMPFADTQFDLVCTEYMLEHVDDPAAVLREVQRLLTPGGQLVLVTPNLWSYKFLVAAATPYSFHKWLGQYRYRRAVDEDMFPTLYRANTLPRLKRMLKTAGFKKIEIRLFSNGPTWFRGMPILFELGCIYHKLIELLPPLAFLRCGIVVVAVKGKGKEAVPATLAVRCLRCGDDNMHKIENAWYCSRCQNRYTIRGNMIDVASGPSPTSPTRPSKQKVMIR